MFDTQDSEEDKNSKKRTAIIVGVAIGGVALFAIGFLASRYCRKRGDFKVMKVSIPFVSVELIKVMSVPFSWILS